MTRRTRHFVLPPDPQPEEKETPQNAEAVPEQTPAENAETAPAETPQTSASEQENSAPKAETAPAEPEENSADLPKNDLLTEQKMAETEKIFQPVSAPVLANSSDDKKTEDIPVSDEDLPLSDGENTPLN